MNEKKTRSLSFSLPRLGLASLLICLISGVVLAFQFRPMGNVFQSVEEITTLIPYGGFFRQLHYGSGQLFVIMMLLHTVDHFLKRRYRGYSFSRWCLLVIPMLLCFFMLFTGFILKADKEGTFAGLILMNILGELPMGKALWARFLIAPGDTFFLLPYLYHCFFTPLLVIYLIRNHIRDWFPNLRFLLIVTLALFIYALMIGPQPDIPPAADISHVRGPWFFLGIQNLLRIMPPLWAGLVIPGTFVGLLLILPLLTGVKGRILHVLLLVVSGLYVLLTFRELMT